MIRKKTIPANGLQVSRSTSLRAMFSDREIGVRINIQA